MFWRNMSLNIEASQNQKFQTQSKDFDAEKRNEKFFTKKYVHKLNIFDRNLIE